MAQTFAVIITALDETWSARDSVQRIVADNKDDVVDIIFAIAPATTPACRAVIDDLERQHPRLVRRHEQSRLPGVGGAVRESAELVSADWIILMAADLETPPANVRDIIARAKVGDVDIVASSRWLKGGSFGDYARVKLLCNWLFQKFFSLLYGARLTDMTFGYRAYPARLWRRYQWRETGHALFMESLVRPLRDGARVVELPAHWRRRQEGESHVKTGEFWRYFRVGLASRFAPKRKDA